THLFTPFGLKTKSGYTNGDVFTIEELQFIPDSTLRCSEYLTDFWVNDSETFDWYKEAILSEITTEIVPKANRKTLAPAEFKDIYGEPSFLDDLQGKYIYIDFWASWCSPCRAEIPSLKKIKQQYKEQNLAFLSLSIDDELNAWQWKAVSEKLEIDWSNWLLEYGKDSSLAKGIQLSGIPRYILLDPEGKIVNDSAPRPSDPKLIEFLDKVLNQ
ncbi:MAG: TlpA disulfide reductase family protein, partial [Bacteroidota bacterium]